MISKRRGLASELRLEAGVRLAAEVGSFLEARPSFDGGVAVFRSLPSEIPMDPVVERLYQNHARLAFPKVLSSGEMEFYWATHDEWQDASQWEKSAFGVEEPLSSLVVKPEDLALILVPGLAFGRQGERVGYGQGHYDRYLARSSAYRLAIGYGFQVFSELPQQSWDQKMNGLVTDEGLIFR